MRKFVLFSLSERVGIWTLSARFPGLGYLSLPLSGLLFSKGS